MHEQKSCGFVLFRNEKEERKYLALRYESGHWGLIKGMVETGEEEVDTATREAMEETGVTDIVTIPGFHESISYQYRWEGKRIHKVVVYFLGKTATSEIKLSHEHTGFRWLSFEDVQKRLSFENDRRVVAKAEALLSSDQKNLASF